MHHTHSFLTQIKSRCCEVASVILQQLNCHQGNSPGLLMSNPIKLMTGYSPPGTSIVMLFPFSRIWSSFVIFLPSGVVSLSRGEPSMTYTTVHTCSTIFSPVCSTFGKLVQITLLYVCVPCMLSVVECQPTYIFCPLHCSELVSAFRGIILGLGYGIETKNGTGTRVWY